MKEMMRETVREMMARAEEAWREYHKGGKVSAWELSEALEEEEGVDDGKFTASIGFNPIFKEAFVKASWWDSPTRWTLLRIDFDEGQWDMHVECQGGESELERVCFELVKEAN